MKTDLIITIKWALVSTDQKYFFLIILSFHSNPDCDSFCWSLRISSRRFICIVSSWNKQWQRFVKMHIAICCIDMSIKFFWFIIIIKMYLTWVDRQKKNNLGIGGDVKPRNSSLLQSILLVYYFLIHFSYNLLIHHSLLLSDSNVQRLVRQLSC